MTTIDSWDEYNDYDDYHPYGEISKADIVVAYEVIRKMQALADKYLWPESTGRGPDGIESITSEGVEFFREVNYACHCHPSMGKVYETIPWTALLNEDEWINDRDKKAKEEAKRIVQEKEKEKQQAEARRLAEEKAEFERLKKKFGDKNV